VALFPRNAWGQRLHDAFVTEAADSGLTLRAAQYYDPAAQDFSGPLRLALGRYAGAGDRDKTTGKPHPRDAAEEGSAFVSAQGADLEHIFAIRHEDRMVANDNTVRVNNLILQIEKSPYRNHFVKCRVEVVEHLEGTYSVTWKKRIIGRYDMEGRPLGTKEAPREPEALGFSLSGPKKRQEKEGRKENPPASSPAVPEALRSLPSVALSSSETTSPYNRVT
jgi:hypothetical protein